MTTTSYLRPDQQAGPADPPERAPRRGLRLALIGAGVVAVAVFLGWLIAFSPVFGVRTVTVHGTKLVTAAQVRAAARISHGSPLVRLDTAAITGRVERLPQIASAQVSTSFPSTVTITVTERTPVGYIRESKGVELVDSDGVQYRRVASAPAHLPRFVVPSGTVAQSTAAALGRVASALPASVRSVVTSIQALDTQAITLTVKNGVLVHWGSADRSADKARVLPTLLSQHPDQIDLTDPDQPVVR